MAKQTKTVDDYYEQMRHNEETFKRLARNIRPEWYVLIDLLEVTRINPLILLKVMRQINNIANGNRYGTVTINIENGVCTFCRGEESDRINEPVILPIDPNKPSAWQA